mmetsp:Transcript_18726/g.31549  ORF Transcript_18726/g.31549 Transcript_18726/m.31549 type:complete len:676 (-) Transcript_18726:69-2096(-)
MNKAALLLVLLVCLVADQWSGHVAASRNLEDKSHGAYEGKIIKGNRNALYLVEKGQRRAFPDFHSFTSRGYDISQINRIDDSILNSIPLGETLSVIAVYRPDDFMYHRVCDDADRMVQELGLIPNMGDIQRFLRVYQRVTQRKEIDIVALGGSITAGGYFMEFARSLEEKTGLTVNVHNHGHGATELQYSIFCVDIDKYPSIDLVLIDFSVNDYGHPKLMDALVRKALALPTQPVVTIVNLWVTPHCGTPRYLLHSYYYHLPMVDVCPAVVLCYGKDHLPKSISNLYSTTDGVHPWGAHGVKFLGDVLFAWWNKLATTVTVDSTLSLDGKRITHAHTFDQLSPLLPPTGANSSERTQFYVNQLPAPMYPAHPIGACTRCDALADDADARLTPVRAPKGFRKVVRMKIGFGGFMAGPPPGPGAGAGAGATDSSNANPTADSSSSSSDSNTTSSSTGTGRRVLQSRHTGTHNSNNNNNNNNNHHHNNAQHHHRPPSSRHHSAGAGGGVRNKKKLAASHASSSTGSVSPNDERVGLSSSGGGSALGNRVGVTKSFRKSWQADTPGSEISFKFYGSTVKIAIWQRRDGMGVIHAYVDGDKNNLAKASGFFKGYSWAMEKNNTGRSEIMTLFEGLPDTEHELTLEVSNEPANRWVPGHLVQVFALLSASDNPTCKNMSFV